MAQAHQEAIFVQTDPTFDIVLNSLTELRNQNRVRITHCRTASVQDIESNNLSGVLRFTFGGLFGFARTASSVLRMCMLAATGINPGLWPTIGLYSQQRNVAKMVVSPPALPFSLAYNQPDARKYWRKYDQLYPHFLIQREIKSVLINTSIRVPSMMIIFRPVGNLTEVIEITTTFTAIRRDQASKCFNSNIHVTCIVRSVREDFRMMNFMDWRFTKTLKEHLNNPFRAMEGFLFNMAQTQEIIFVQTDPAFNIVLNSLTELNNQGRLQVTHFQTASLHDIESNNPNLNLMFTFGGLNGFGRTASSVLRMCMLAATNIDEDLWPTIGQYSQQRNVEKMDVQLPDLPMSLAENPEDALKYWSNYDQLYPHFFIQQEIQSVPINTLISLPSMMIICRSVGHLTEVIEINTTFHVTRRDQASTCFDSYIHVTCIVRSFQKNLMMDGPFTQNLNAELLNRPPGTEGLPFDFSKLAISPR